MHLFKATRSLRLSTPKRVASIADRRCWPRRLAFLCCGFVLLLKYLPTSIQVLLHALVSLTLPSDGPSPQILELFACFTITNDTLAIYAIYCERTPYDGLETRTTGL